MSSHELILLSPYRFPGSNALTLATEDMACWLNAHAALWHPAALWQAQGPSRVDATYDHETPKAGCIYVVPKAGQQAPTVAELATFMQQAGAAKFKWPERVEAIDALPLTKVGKLDKGAMRQLIADKMSGEGVPNGK